MSEQNENKEKLDEEKIKTEAETDNQEEETTNQEAKTEAEDSNAQEESQEEDLMKILRGNKDQIKKLTNEVETLKERLLRINAEYDNYRKRTAKEKEGIYTDACYDVLKEIIPVVDNIERAYMAEGNIDDLKKGIEMTIKGLESAFAKLGVEEIDASSDFDPNLHQAVMHVDDDTLGANQVAEVFQKGYKRGDKVIRHTVVKVAN